MQKLKLAVDSLKNNKALVQKIENGMLLVTTPNAIVLRTTRDRNNVNNNVTENILAVMLNGKILGNSDRMRDAKNVELTNAFQRPLSDMIPMIPFSSIKRSGLSLKNFVEVDKGNEETVYLNQWGYIHGEKALEVFEEKYKDRHNAKFDSDKNIATWQEPRHFTGARLFKIDDSYFLMDIDRGEIIHGIFNPFLVKLPRAVQSIDAAYQSLKPGRVLDAESQGLSVKRQGEWFFIPCRDKDIPANIPAERMELRAGQNRPNRVESGVVVDGVSFVKGKITHPGREHKDITLDTWHIAVPNTSVTSWQLSGDID